MPLLRNENERDSSRFDFNKVKLVNQKETLSRKSPQVPTTQIFKQMLKNLLTVLVVLLAIGVTWFLNSPQPPVSPILFQWQTMGNSDSFKYRGHNIFYLGERNSTRSFVCSSLYISRYQKHKNNSRE